MRKCFCVLSRLLPFLFIAAAPAAFGIEKKILVIAHRGSPAYLPEHTLQGAAMAYAFGADFIEPDLVMTKDDQLIVVHDIHLDTISDVAVKFPTRKRADGHWYVVDFTLLEVKTLNAHERTNEKKDNKVAVFEKRFPVGLGQFQIPTLLELVDLVRGLNISRQKNVGLYIEMKNPTFHKAEGKDIAKKLTEFLTAQALPAENLPIIIQCFDSRTLRRLRDEFKLTLPLVQLIAENSWKETDLDYTKMLTPEGIKDIATYANGIGPYMNQLVSVDPKTRKITSSNLVAEAHKNKLFVHTFTIRKDDLPKIIKSIDDLHALLFQTLGVDGAFTDFSDLTRKYLDEHPYVESVGKG